MKRKIIGFDKDELGDWRAELECGHFQHLRHDPPLTTRPWILDEAERQKKLGVELDCKKCDEAMSNREFFRNLNLFREFFSPRLFNFLL